MSKFWRQYHAPGQGHYVPVKKNVVCISVANSIEHEIEKLKVCYDLKKQGRNFITEAVDNKLGLRRDVIDIDSGLIYEIETDKQRAKRFLLDPHTERIKVIQI